MVVQCPVTSPTLLEKISKGDEIGWSEFYEKYSPIILAMARYKGIRGDRAQDIVQEVMKCFFDMGQHFVFQPEKGRFRTYFAQIVRARIADFFRKDKASGQVSVDCNGDVLEPQRNGNVAVVSIADPESDEKVFLAEWRKAQLNDAYGRLRERVSPETWQAFELYYLQGRDVRKVAKYLECSLNQIYQAKKRCVAMLRSICAELERVDGEVKLEVQNEGIQQG